MKLRTVFLKVSDIQKAKHFWEKFLNIAPHKNFDSWCEFMVGNVRFALLLNDFGDEFTGSNCVPVFELKDHEEVLQYVDKAKSLGAKVIENNLDNSHIATISIEDPFGNEFELTTYHH